MLSRILLILFALLTSAAFYIALIYFFITRIWPLLPLWINAVVAILLALAVILPPFMWLLRLGDMKPRPPSPPS